ncbi:MAG: hypothetical protein AAF515_07700 [Pseudomonadota bacterium]
MICKNDFENRSAESMDGQVYRRGMLAWAVRATLLITLVGCGSDAATSDAAIDGATSQEAHSGLTTAAEVELQGGAEAAFTPFLPAAFDAPTLVETAQFNVVPLGPELVDVDYEAYMSSIDHLQRTFTRSTSWPTADIDAAAAMLDMETEAKRFSARDSFAYGVLTPDGDRERGCIYIQPSTKPGFDAVVKLWVTKQEYDDGFDVELYAWTQRWLEDWPFVSVAYPGRSIEWSEWDALADGPSLIEQNLATAEAFIDAFYSFDQQRLLSYLETATESREGIAYYQGWAEGGNYKVLERAGCVAETAALIRCPITVQDDPVLALETGFNVTDTFALSFSGADIVEIDTSSNDQPVYYQARDWVRREMPEVMSGACKDYGSLAGTPGDCARAMTAGYKAFAASSEFPASSEEEG